MMFRIVSIDAAMDIVTSRSLSPYLTTIVSRMTSGMQTPVAVIPDLMPDRILAASRTLGQ